MRFPLKPKVPSRSAAAWTFLHFVIGSVAALAQPANSQTNFFLPKNPVAAAYVLGRLSNQELISAPRSEFVYVALLQRAGLERKYRQEALEGLAGLRHTDTLTELLGAMAELDKKGEQSTNVLRDLAPLLLQSKQSDLAGKRSALERSQIGRAHV